MSWMPAVLELTPAEQELLQRITFDPSAGHDLRHASIEPAGQLARSLLDRTAVPEVRLRYFDDPECNIGGRGKSRHDVFVRNGTSGEDILRHPNFLKHLQYFIYGPQLPARAISEFSDQVEALGGVSGTDVEVVRKLARLLTRRFSLNTSTAAEEFYKLALELDLADWHAESIRKAVMEVRPSSR